MALAAAAAVLLAVASVCPPSLAHPAGAWGYSNSFRQYMIALGEAVTVQSPGFPTSVPPSAKYGWNVLCLPSENTTLLISCYVNIEDSPLCFWSSLTIKTNDEDRRLCGKEHLEKFVSSTGFARFEFSSERKVIDEGFICEAKCQAPEAITSSPTTPGTEANAAPEAITSSPTTPGTEANAATEAITSSPTTPGTEANAATEALEGEIVTDDGSEDLETVIDGAKDLETETGTVEDLDTVIDGAEDLETVIDGAKDLEKETGTVEDLDTVIDGTEDLETVIDGAEDLETEAGTVEDLDTVIDGAEDLESLPGGAEDLEKVTDFAED